MLLVFGNGGGGDSVRNLGRREVASKTGNRRGSSRPLVVPSMM